MNSQLSWSIIKQFSGRNMLGFTFQDVARDFPEKNRVYLARLLADMVDKRMLYKIARDNYHIIPLNADPETYVPHGHQVAKYIMQNKEYYIGYASALKILGLTLQSETREYVVTKKQMKPAIRNFGGIEYQFIHHDATRFFGFSSTWINQLEEAMVSDLERTIVDVATKPQLCGGIVEVGNAIFQAKDRTDHDKLFYYFARNRNKSAKKRFLFLSELLGLEWTTDHERMMQELGSGSSLLDPKAPDQGRKQSRFGLKINVDPIGIKKKILPKYRT
ncbi:MAG: type IV toxin-antitoxin system AbiEi family antitoxin [Bacteroidota bacterium]